MHYEGYSCAAVCVFMCVSYIFNSLYDGLFSL